MKHNFFRLRRCSIAVCLLAMLAMLASAVSACACTHHEMQAAVEQTPSCHSASHEKTVAPADPVISGAFRAGCSCFAAAPVLAVAAKSESKKFSVEKAVAADEKLSLDTSLPLFSDTESVDFDSAAFVYSGRSLTSGPSRAPPRL